ncbi:MAG: hypothetical protein C0508_08030 [Cyanobacteria bacterium PR.023]|nr:hypothetical protein [Cyanobacteria bacterium PR.023]
MTPRSGTLAEGDTEESKQMLESKEWKPRDDDNPGGGHDKETNQVNAHQTFMNRQSVYRFRVGKSRLSR